RPERSGPDRRGWSSAWSGAQIRNFAQKPAFPASLRATSLLRCCLGQAPASRTRRPASFSGPRLMSLYNLVARPLLFTLDAEKAHGLSIAALKVGAPV